MGRERDEEESVKEGDRVREKERERAWESVCS
jgi:hypothetical protein